MEAVAPVVIVGTAIVRGGLLLAQQRAYPAQDAGLWELPGGRVEPGESDADAVRRECAEELGVRVAVGERVGADVPLPGGKVLRVYAATFADGSPEPHAVEHRALRWVAAPELAAVEWLPADVVLVPALAELLRGYSGGVTGLP
ncbi:NUDIX domain-containing protein [Saccharomonospora sp. NPDC046836]|uniref:(deoxy)nucleoside triphosphate pyrophosphohydrolase n=1 Tax=Saccharomonospora sp. NPDC046836 TaxID=3156921 RepID=UPI00340A787F